MGTLGAKTSQWRPGHVPYLPYPRYVTGSMPPIQTTIFFYFQKDQGFSFLDICLQYRVFNIRIVINTYCYLNRFVLDVHYCDSTCVY
jgi:hypothetical protein